MVVKDAINAVSKDEGTKPLLKGVGKRRLLLFAFLIVFNLVCLLVPESIAVISPVFLLLDIAYVR